jgi:hypothetical protein
MAWCHSAFDSGRAEANMRDETELDSVMACTSQRRKALTILIRRRQTIRTYLECVVVAALLVLVASIAMFVSR